MHVEQPEMLTPDNAPGERWERGWYEFAGGLRFYDGNSWTDHYAPPARNPKPIDYGKITLSVAGGMILGWFLIWLGAQVAPDEIYWPVKFVVEELPEGFR
jgi:hypothetical protein